MCNTLWFLTAAQGTCQVTKECLTHLSRALRCFPKAKGDCLYYVGLSLSFCLISGLCAITGVSVFANMLVTNFWMSTANMYQGMQNVQNRYVVNWLRVLRSADLLQGQGVLQLKERQTLDAYESGPRTWKIY